jgi:phenylalanyl-tRNA synthetase alpha subunit
LKLKHSKAVTWVAAFFFLSLETMSDLDTLVSAARSDFAAAATPADLENAKARYLGKAGRVTELLKALGTLSVEEKKSRGAQINATKQQIEAALEAAREALASAALDAQLKAEALDVTLPGRQRGVGGLHPVARMMERIEAIFGSMGFDVADGPEIETDWMSFTALNNPENHPARSMQDTFYVDMKATGSTCARTRARCRCATRARMRRSTPVSIRCPRFASSRRAARTAWTATPRIRRCSIRSKACGWARTSASRT